MLWGPLHYLGSFLGNAWRRWHVSKQLHNGQVGKGERASRTKRNYNCLLLLTIRVSGSWGMALDGSHTSIFTWEWYSRKGRQKPWQTVPIWRKAGFFLPPVCADSKAELQAQLNDGAEYVMSFPAPIRVSSGPRVSLRIGPIRKSIWWEFWHQ